MRFVVMGVSGCGKSHIGAAFAKATGATYIDGDDLHLDEHIAKMAAGQPLTDADRGPWLDRVGAALSDAADGAVMCCSALRRAYRDRIAAAVDGPVTFLHLSGSPEVIAERLNNRAGHFMPPALLESQFAALEVPTADEAVVSVDIDQSPEAVLGQLLEATREMRS